jgi:hypothetical protein
MTNKLKTSARLRVSESLASLVGFKYDSKRYPYGGFFSTWELEKITEKLKSDKELIERLQAINAK